MSSNYATTVDLKKNHALTASELTAKLGFHTTFGLFDFFFHKCNH